MFAANNAIGWVNFQMSGGVRRTAWVVAGVAIVLPLLMFGTSQIDETAVQRSMRSWYAILSFIQGALLLFAVPSRVHGAIKRDRQTTKILELHRLMPVRPSHAIVGYIVGPNLLIGGIVAVVFAIGLFVATLALQDWRGWIAMHVAAGAMSLSLCCLSAFLSQWMPRLVPAFVNGIVGVIGTVAFAVLPGVRVMFAPFVANLPQLARGEIEVQQLVAGASQLGFAAILFVGAARRYRRDDVPILGFGWGLALLALWVGVTLIGTLDPRRFSADFYAEDRVTTIAYVVSTSLAMLLAIGPIASAATARLRWRERTRIDPYFDERAPTSLAPATILTLVVVAALLLAAPDRLEVPNWVRNVTTAFRPTWRHLLLDVGVIAAFGMTVAMLAHAAGRLRLPVTATIAAWTLLTWVIPPLVDGVAASLTAHNQRFPRPLGAASPPFALQAIWTGDLNAATVGLIAQAAAIPLLFVAWRLIPRRGRRADATPGVPAAIANA